MAEKPILFNTKMVQAIQAGLKTQTRRIIKGLPLHEPYFEVDEDQGFMMDSEDGQFYPLEAFSNVQPLDVLWVRETWHGLKTGNEKFGHHKTFWYKADEKDENPEDKWRPSIHMPREAARIFLRVTGLRAERLQSITIEEIKAEGLTSAAVHAGDKEIAFAEFKLLWNSTIKKDDIPRYGWDANPWVWVIEFEKMEAQHG